MHWKTCSKASKNGTFRWNMFNIFTAWIIFENLLHFMLVWISAYGIYLQLILANPGTVVIEKLESSKLTNLIGQDNIFLTVSEAVMSVAPKAMEEVWWSEEAKLNTFFSERKYKTRFKWVLVLSANKESKNLNRRLLISWSC